MLSSKRPRLGLAFFAFASAVFCALNATQNMDAICITTGCEIFKDVSIFGISLWWYGTALFLSLSVLNLIKYAKTAFALALVAVIVDLGFLLLMIFTAPCVPCLVFAGLLLIQLYMQSKVLKKPRRVMVPVLILWTLLFAPNIFSTINEELGTWAITGPEVADVQVFFSPSCTACRSLIPNLTQSGAKNIRFYPIAETDADVDAILIMQRAIEHGSSLYIAFNRAIRPGTSVPEATLRERLTLQWNLFRNKSKLGAMGITKIPVLVTNGAPSSLLQHESKPRGSSDLLDFTDDFTGCAKDSPIPCD